MYIIVDKESKLVLSTCNKIEVDKFNGIGNLETLEYYEVETTEYFQIDSIPKYVVTGVYCYDTNKGFYRFMTQADETAAKLKVAKRRHAELADFVAKANNNDMDLSDVQAAICELYEMIK